MSSLRAVHVWCNPPMALQDTGGHSIQAPRCHAATSLRFDCPNEKVELAVSGVLGIYYWLIGSICRQTFDGSKANPFLTSFSNLAGPPIGSSKTKIQFSGATYLRPAQNPFFFYVKCAMPSRTVRWDRSGRYALCSRVPCGGSVSCRHTTRCLFFRWLPAAHHACAKVTDQS